MSTYGSNYTMTPAHATITRAQVDKARAGTAPLELRPLYSYQHYDDAVAIYRRCPRPLNEHDTWEAVGVILFAPLPGEPTALRIYALEVADDFARGDVERHIPLLFGVEEAPA